MSGASKGGRKAVRGAIERAAAAKPSASPPPPANDGGKPPPSPPDRLGGRFRMERDGLWRVARDASRETDMWLCGPFELLAETRDEEGGAWGLLLGFRDRDGERHEVALPRRNLAGDGVAVREMLSDAGLSLAPQPQARAAMMEYLSAVISERRARSVPRLGWHRIGGNLVFVLPDEVFGTTSERVILAAEERATHAFRQAGTVAQWRDEVGALCIGNSRLVFSACCAFAGPLMMLAGADGGGFNIKGASRLGKSTALRVAASVWGGEPGSGAQGFVRQWRATSNGIEGLAAAHSDALLPMDELGQMDARDAGEAAYMLANGRGKTRASRSGATRPELRWRVLILSTGEEGIADKNAEAGKRTRAGQEVRLVDVPADAGAGLGLFEALHGEVGPGNLAERIKAATAACYGAPGRAFLGWLLAELERDEAGFCLALRDERDGMMRAMLPEAAGGQVRSVAASFALVAVAGEMAARAGIAPWPETDAEAAASTCFRAWLSERGTVGAKEDAQAVVALQGFLNAHGAARFELWRDAASEAQDEQTRPDLPPAERYRTVNRAGWRRWQQTAEGAAFAWHYYLTPDGMKEALRGLTVRDATSVLAARGYLMPPDKGGKHSRSMTPPGNPKMRLYPILPSLFDADEGAA